MGRITIPRFERHHLPEFLADEFCRERDAGIEAPVVADLKNPSRRRDLPPQFLAFLDADAERFLDQDMLPRGHGLQGQRDVELIRDADEHRLHLRVRQHLVEFAMRKSRLMQQLHLPAQIVGKIADRRELDVARLSRRIEMRHLRDRPAAEHAEAKQAGVFGHRGTSCPAAVRTGNRISPDACRMESTIAAVDPLPLVPAM